jgi:hypothetical protein
MLKPKCSFGVGMDWANERVLVITNKEKMNALIRDITVVYAL